MPQLEPELVVVPTERHVELAATRGARAITRSVLASQLFSELGPRVELASELGVWLATSHALEHDAQVREALAAGNTPGTTAWTRTVDALDQTLATLRAHAVLAGHLRTVRDRARLPTLEALASLLDGLDTRLKARGLLDPRLCPLALAAAIEGADPARVALAVRAERVVFRHVIAWEPADLSWVSKLALALNRAGGEVDVELPTLEDMPSESFDAILAELAARLPRPPRARQLAAVLGDLSPRARPADEARVGIALVPDETAQIQAAAELVARAVEGGSAVDRIAIVASRMDPLRTERLSRALAELGIESTGGSASPIVEAPRVAFVLEILRAAAGESGFDAARSVALTSLVDWRGVTPAGQPSLSRGRSLMRRALDETFVRFGSTLAEVLHDASQAWPGRHRVSKSDAEALDAFAAYVGGVARRLAEPRSRTEHAEHLLGLIASLHLAPDESSGVSILAQDGARTALDRAALDAMARDWSAFSAFLRAVEAYRDETCFEMAPVVEVGTFMRELQRYVEGVRVGPKRSGVGGVGLGVPAGIAGRALDLVVVLDAIDGRLPTDESPDPFLGDRIWAALASTEGSRETSYRPDKRAAQLVTLGLLAAHASRIELLVPAHDATGAPAVPAAFVSSLATTVGKRAICARAALATFGRESAARARELDARAALEYERERDHASAQSEAIDPGSSTTPIARLVRRSLGDAPTSATALERWMDCPFRGFAAQALGVHSPRDAGETVDARRLGELAHDALRAAFEATAAMWSKRPRDEAKMLELGELAAREVLARSEDGTRVSRAVAAGLLARVQTVLAELVRDDAWDPVHAELAFGYDGSPWAPLTIELDGVRVDVRGRIDRLDREHGGKERARVVDYKRSVSKSAKHDPVQLAIYARAAAASGSLGEVGAIYAPIRNVGKSSKPYASAELDETLQQLEARLRVALAGNVDPDPRRDETCLHCDYDASCRRPRVAERAEE